MKYLLKISLKYTKIYATKKCKSRRLLPNLSQYYKDSDQVFGALTEYI
jgi:hypothetical protein